MTEVLKAGVLSDEIDLGALAHNAAEQAEVFVRKVWEASWKVCHFKNLPGWLQDNDFLHKGECLFFLLSIDIDRNITAGFTYFPNLD